MPIVQTQISLGIQPTNKLSVHCTNSDQPGYSINQQNTCLSFKLRSAWAFNQPTKYLSILQTQIRLGIQPTLLYKLRSAWVFNQPTNYLPIEQTQISLGIQSTNKIPVHPSNSDQTGYSINQQNTRPLYKLRSAWVFNKPYCTNSDQPGY